MPSRWHCSMHKCIASRKIAWLFVILFFLKVSNFKTPLPPCDFMQWLTILVWILLVRFTTRIVHKGLVPRKSSLIKLRKNLLIHFVKTLMMTLRYYKLLYVRDFNFLTNSETLFIIYTLLSLVNTSVSESHWLHRDLTKSANICITRFLAVKVIAYGVLKRLTERICRINKCLLAEYSGIDVELAELNPIK
jgi:hypothetical protein